MALTEFLRRFVPQFTRDHRIRRGIGSSRRSQRGPTAPQFESLEARTLLAAVAWDGGGGDFEWTNPLNWSGDVLPGATDDVVINVSGDITVRLAGSNPTLRSLTSEESLILASGSLKVTAASEVRGAFSTGTNTTLTAVGTEAVFRATGPTTLGKTNLLANNGGTIDLPNATGYSGATDGDVNLLANGSGSQLLLTSITSLTGVGRHGRVAIKATNGGNIDLSGLITIPSGTTEISAKDAGSFVDVSNLQTWSDANRWRSSSVTWGNGGIVNVNSLHTVSSVGVTANTGDTLILPAVTHMGAGTDTTSLLLADGANSRIEFPLLTTMDGTNRHGQTDIRARNGGAIDMSSVTDNLNGTTSISVFDAGSVIDLSGLQTWTDGNQFRHSSITWGNGGTVNVDSLHTISSVGIVANTGDTLVFPALNAMRGGGDTSALVLADGANSRIEFPSLTTMDGTNRHGQTDIRARNGGVIDMSSVIDNVNGTTAISALDVGSVIDLSSLQTWTDGNQFRSSSLTWGNGGAVNVDSLETVINVSLLATGGNILTFPALTRIGGTTDSASVILADGAGSRLEFPAVTVADGTRRHGDVAFRARTGGVVNLPALLNITTGSVNVSAFDTDGAGNSSTVNMPVLQTWNHGNIFRGSSVTSGREGVVNVGSLSVQTDIQRVYMRAFDDGRLDGGRLQLLSGTTLTGDGTVAADVVNTLGRVQAGDSVGVLTIDGDFENRVNGVVAINVGGTVAGVDSDHFVVTGTATLDGNLAVSVAATYSPTVGDQILAFSFGHRVCDFLTKTGLDLGNGLYLAAAFDLSSMTLNAGNTPDSGQQCQTVPVLTNVDVGPDPAKAGDVLSITFEVDVPLLNTPDVTVAGNSAALSAQNGSLYTFTYTVAGTETEGLVDVVMTTTSLDGGVGTETESTELDFTAPVITAIVPGHAPADVGTLLAVTFNTSEALSDSTEVLIGGQPATRISQTMYSRLLTGDEGLGQVTIEVAAVDLAGNTSTTTGQVLIVSGGFDVNVTGIDLSDDHPSVGQTVSVSSQVHNSGLYDAINVPVRLALVEPDGDEIILTDTVVPLIPAGSSAIVTTNIDLTTSGVHVLRLHVDPNNVIPEITELDNIATRSLIVDSGVNNVMDINGSLSLTSVSPASQMTASGTASWLAGLNPAGVVAGGLTTLSVSGTLISGTVFTNSNGDFTLTFDSPVVPGNYVANVVVSDVTTESPLALPFTVTAPAGGVDFFTNNTHVGSSDFTPVINSAVTLSARVYNVGGDDFGGVTNVRFYDGGTLIGTQSVTGLTSQASAVVSFSHTFTTVGAHVITAIVDEDDLTVETNEGNNVGTRTITVLDNVPDLSPLDILFSDTTPATTDTVTLTAIVRNAGGTAASNVVVRFFDSGNPLGAAVIPLIAGDGGTEFVSIQAILPVAGLRDVSVVVDPDNNVAETDETNNIRIETITVHDPAPDLEASVITLSNNTPVANETFDVSMSVSNNGELDSGDFDAEFRSDGVAFGTVRVSGLAAGSSTIVSLQTSFSVVGGHEVSVVLDAASEIGELSETNNSASKTLQVLATPLSDLRIIGSEIGLSDPNPGAGETVTVSVPIRNIDLATATGVTAELRIDGNIIGSASSSPTTINSGAVADWTFNFVTPTGDGFHLLEIIVDQNNLIGESDEDNNRGFLQFLVGDHPDLLPSGITFSHESPAEGNVVTVSATVSNDGDAAAGEFLVRILDGSQQIGQVTVTGLAIGASTVVSVPFDTTGRVGQRLIQVIVDPGHLIAEANEGDNLISRNLVVTSADPIAPTTVATPSVAANAAGWNNSDVDVVLTATDNAGGSGVAYLRYSVDGGTFQTPLGDTQTVSFSDEGVHTIRVQAFDFAQNAEDLQTLTIRIDKTAPLAVHSGPFTVNEGSSILLDGTASSDGLSGLAQIAWAVDGDNLFNDGNPATFTGLDGPSTHDVLLRAVDVAGNEAVVTTQVNVQNVGPTANAGPDATLLHPQAGVFSRGPITIIDPGADVWTGTVNYGDSATDFSLSINQITKEFNLSHTYAVEGTFTVTVTVNDDDTATHVDTFEVTVVLNAPPVIAAQSFAAAENQTTVGTVIATDDDLPTDTQTFAITGNGADDAKFAITTGGVLTFIAAPDFENPTDLGGTADDNIYLVEVEVKDDAGETDTAIMTVTVDDVQYDVSITANDADAAEPSDDGQFTVSLPAGIVAPTGGLDVDYTFTGTATAADYTALSGTVTILAGQNSATIDVDVVDENLVELDESVIVTLDATDDPDFDIAAAPNDTATVTILDNDNALVSIVSTSDATEAGTGSGKFTVTQSAVSSTDTVVTYSVGVGSTATNGGTDYITLSGSVTIIAGDTTADIDVTGIVDDSIVEADETVIVQLNAATGDQQISVDTGNDTATVTILDNDTATFTINSVDRAEGTGGTTDFDFPVTLDNPIQGGFDLSFFVNDGFATSLDDFEVLTTSPLNFQGNAGETHVIRVRVIGDSTVEIDELFTVGLSDANLPDEISLLADNGNQGLAFGIIRNDDQASISINDVMLDEGNGLGTTAFTFTVSLDKPASRDITVVANTSGLTANGGGIDFDDIVNRTLTIPAGETSTTVTVDTVGELSVEADETFEVRLVNSRFNGQGDATRLVISDGTGIGTILNDDSALVSIVSTSDATEAGTGSGKFTVTQSAVSSTDTVVTYSVGVGSTATNGGTDYITLSGSVTVLAGDTTADIDVTGIIDDSIVEADETVIVQLNAATGDQQINVDTANDTATVTILDNDTASLIIDDVSVVEGDAPGSTTFTFTVSIDPASGGTTASKDITVVANTNGVTAAGGGVDFDNVTNQTITIAAGTTSETVTVTVVRENLAEANETFEVDLSDARFNGATDATRVVIGDGTGIGTIVNDDFAPVASAGGPYVIDEGTGLTLNASASTDADVPADTLTYRWDVDNDGDFDESVTGVTPSLTWAQLVALGIDDGPYLDDVTVEVSDGTNVTENTSTLQIDNVAPTAQPDAFVADVFTLRVGNLLVDNGNGADNDPAGSADPLVVVAADSANAFQSATAVVPGGTAIVTELGGRVIINPDGTFTYDATASGTLLSLAEGVTLDDSFTYDISDGDGGVDTAIVTVTVTGGSDNSVHIIDCVCDGGNTQTLVVRGSLGDDKIDIKLGSVAGTFKIKIKAGSIGGSIGGSMGSIGPGGGSMGNQGSFHMGTFKFEGPADGISKIIVYGLDGNDNIKVSSNADVMAWLFGGQGNDKLRGGKGDDLLVGGPGNDKLDGNAGRDILIGGLGADKLQGQKDEDILIAAATAYDSNLAALCGIQREWLKLDADGQGDGEDTDDAITRAEIIRDNYFTGGLLGGAGFTVDDGEQDKLKGGSGADWFIAHSVEDKIKDDNDDIFGLDSDWFHLD